MRLRNATSQECKCVLHFTVYISTAYVTILHDLPYTSYVRLLFQTYHSAYTGLIFPLFPIIFTLLKTVTKSVDRNEEYRFFHGGTFLRKSVKVYFCLMCSTIYVGYICTKIKLACLTNFSENPKSECHRNSSSFGYET